MGAAGSALLDAGGGSLLYGGGGGGDQEEPSRISSRERESVRDPIEEFELEKGEGHFGELRCQK
jgi:hypothetical protein